MKAALSNEVGLGFDTEDIEISAPAGRDVLAAADPTIRRVAVTSC